MKQLFQIENTIPGSSPRILSLRIGEKHACFAVTSGTELCQLAYCITGDETADHWNESQLAELNAAYPALQGSYEQVLVAYDFPYSLFVSSADYKKEEAGMLLQTTGAGENGVGTDLLDGWQIYNIYAVNREAGQWISEKFPSARSWHQYSAAIQKNPAAEPAGNLLIDFRTHDFTIIVRKAHQLLLAQTFTYSTPEDVLYHLLNTCEQFSLSQQELQVQLSGLIDKQSSLYNELYQYFIHLEFREADWKTNGEYPGHFFTTLNDLARCAS